MKPAVASCGQPEKSQFFLPITKGRIWFSTKFVSNCKWGWSKKTRSFSHWLARYERVFLIEDFGATSVIRLFIQERISCTIGFDSDCLSLKCFLEDNFPLFTLVFFRSFFRIAGFLVSWFDQDVRILLAFGVVILPDILFPFVFEILTLLSV